MCVGVCVCVCGGGGGGVVHALVTQFSRQRIRIIDITKLLVTFNYIRQKRNASSTA